MPFWSVLLDSVPLSYKYPFCVDLGLLLLLLWNFSPVALYIFVVLTTCIISTVMLPSCIFLILIISWMSNYMSKCPVYKHILTSHIYIRLYLSKKEIYHLYTLSLTSSCISVSMCVLTNSFNHLIHKHEIILTSFPSYPRNTTFTCAYSALKKETQIVG